ncbi:hypothetical protein ASD44_09855 [Mesorhizobium sp. Root554]|uniref:hypothetical protein n=1 Tax=unclassified Mesorhizobium TaxID=325217 RepID=UPI0006FC2CAD|nr:MULTISPECIES: hypothetical protein [unclassified Mesorhizobium]KQZ14342.1 hypothetical protein ASD27_09865 [Mesorhizobium sp. Root1471]KQZ36853.1 hypothetical protein ASD44_09855 [Mesorhizobium sp. Root554]
MPIRSAKRRDADRNPFWPDPAAPLPVPSVISAAALTTILVASILVSVLVGCNLLLGGALLAYVAAALLTVLRWPALFAFPLVLIVVILAGRARP